MLTNSELEVPEQAHAMVMPLRGTKLPEKPRRRGSMHRIVAETTSAQIKSFLSIAVVNMKSQVSGEVKVRGGQAICQGVK